MQRIANLLAIQDGQVLLLQKPRRGWYVAPGGKMEVGESIYEAAIREFQEETGASPKNVHLKGIYTIIIKEESQIIDEWMLFTFVSYGIEGTPAEQTKEGTLEWHPLANLHQLPMAEGDRENLVFVANKEGIQYGTFEYTKDFELLAYRTQASINVNEEDAVHGE